MASTLPKTGGQAAAGVGRLNYQWIRELEVFIASKLRGTSRYGFAMVPDAGPLIDGMILAFDDHPELHVETLQAVISVLRTSLSAEDACLRYHSWCLIDAVLKQSALEPLRAGLLKAVPTLVSQELPLGKPQLLGDYLLAYLELLRSWVEMRLFSPDVQDEIERHFEHLTTTASKAAAKTGGSAAGSRVAEVMKSLQEQRKRPRETEVAAPSTAVAAPPGRRQLVGDDRVHKFLAQLYDYGRMQLNCMHCGAPFTSAAARTAHHEKVCFRVPQSTTAVHRRLHFPIASEFQAHSPQQHATGIPLKLVALEGEADREGYYPKLQQRSQGKGLVDSVGSGGVVVSSLSVKYHCALCHQEVTPMLDPASATQVWVLQGCVKLTASEGAEPGSEAQVAHRSCLSASS